MDACTHNTERYTLFTRGREELPLALFPLTVHPLGLPLLNSLLANDKGKQAAPDAYLQVEKRSRQLTLSSAQPTYVGKGNGSLDVFGLTLHRR